MRRGVDIQVTRMMLRRIRDNAQDADKITAPLKSVLKHSTTTADFLRTSKGINRLVLTMKHHRDNPAILKLILSVLKHSLTKSARAVDASTSAWEMCKEYAHEDLIQIISNNDYPSQSCRCETVRRAIHLLALIVDYWSYRTDLNCQSFRTECSAKGMHLAVRGAMFAYPDDEEICDAGVYLLYWLECATDEDVQRTLYGGQALLVAIDGGLDEFHGRLDRGDREEMRRFLDTPGVLSAFRRDPIMGVLRMAWERHKDANEKIATYGLEVQFAVIERQRRDRRLIRCTTCEKRLPKSKERLICSSCRSVVYCSIGCQKKHWKKEHRFECKRATDETRE